MMRAYVYILGWEVKVNSSFNKIRNTVCLQSIMFKHANMLKYFNKLFQVQCAGAEYRNSNYKLILNKIYLDDSSAN